MNKLSIYLAAAVFAFGMASCEDDKEPVYHDPTTFVLDTPADQDTPVDLKAGETLTLQCHQPNYGYQAVTNYTIVVSLTESFEMSEEVKPNGTGTQAKMEFDQSKIAKAICNLHGYTDAEHPANDEFTYEPLYIRAIAQINGIESSRIESENFVILNQVKAYYPAPEITYLYTPGQANGWSGAASQSLMSEDNTTYTGYAVLDPGGFKFTSQTDWGGTNYGNAGQKGKLTTDGNAGNLTVEDKGLYWCDVNIVKLTYTATLCTTYGLIGDAVGGWDASKPLTPSADFLTWEGDITFGNGNFKFRANDGWDINLGGKLDELKPNGSDIPSPGSGTYHVVLQFAKRPYSATVTKL